MAMVISKARGLNGADCRARFGGVRRDATRGRCAMGAEADTRNVLRRR